MPMGYPTSLSSALSSVPLDPRSRVNPSKQAFRTNASLLAAQPAGSLPPALSHPPALPRTIRHKHSQSLAVMPSTPVPTPRPTTRNRGFSRNRRRLASIFDLSEEELRQLGVQTKKAQQTLPQIVTDDLPRSSIDSAETSAFSIHDHDDSPMFTLSNNSSVSTLPTDVSRPASPIEATPTLSSKRKRGANAPPLALDLTPKTDSAGSTHPFTPRNANIDFGVLTSPVSPTTPAILDIQTRRLAKLSRTLGENVPPELVFGVGKVSKGRRASLSSAIDVAGPAQRSNEPAMNIDMTMSNTPQSTSRPSLRARSNTATRPRSRAPFTASAAEPLPTTQQAEASFAPVPPVFVSGPTKVSGETWVGSWNRPDMHAVQAELRALRWR